MAFRAVAQGKMDTCSSEQQPIWRNGQTEAKSAYAGSLKHGFPFLSAGVALGAVGADISSSPHPELRCARGNRSWTARMAANIALREHNFPRSAHAGDGNAQDWYPGRDMLDEVKGATNNGLVGLRSRR
jgi:hypothetical protein